jgi:hypothetical protein
MLVDILRLALDSLMVVVELLPISLNKARERFVKAKV